MTPAVLPWTRAQIEERFPEGHAQITAAEQRGTRLVVTLTSGTTVDLPADPQAFAPLAEWLAQEHEGRFPDVAGLPAGAA